MDFDDAIKMATELDVAFNSDNFKFKDGKFYYTNINLMVKKYRNDIEAERN